MNPLDSEIYKDKTVCGQFARAMYGQLFEEVDKVCQTSMSEPEMKKVAVMFEATCLFFEKQLKVILRRDKDSEMLVRVMSVLKGIHDGCVEQIEEGNYVLGFIKNVVTNLMENTPKITNGEYEEKFQRAKDDLEEFMTTRGKQDEA